MIRLGTQIFQFYDDFLSPWDFGIFSTDDFLKYEEIANEHGPSKRQTELMRRCRSAAEEIYPDLILVDQVDWPRLNQIPPGQTKKKHVDSGMISCVYHITVPWSGGGELRIFADEELPVPITVEYKPNRLVIFDASLPHMVDVGQQVRYTLHVPFAIQKEGEKDG